MKSDLDLEETKGFILLYASSRKQLSLVLLVALSILLSLTECSFAFQGKDDRSFREFGKDLVPTPTELSEHLALLRLKKEPMSDFNDAMREQLEKAGSELFNQLDEEQREKAQAIARNLLSGDPSKAQEANDLYNMFGAEDKKKIKDLISNIPPDVREHFADKYKNYQQNKKNSRQFDAMRALDRLKKQERDTGFDNGDARTDRNDRRTGESGRTESGMNSVEKNGRTNQKDGFQERSGKRREQESSSREFERGEIGGTRSGQGDLAGDGSGVDVDELLKRANGDQDLERLKSLIDQQAKAQEQLKSRKKQLSRSELARQQKKLAERMAQMERMKERLASRENAELDSEFEDIFNIDKESLAEKKTKKSDRMVDLLGDKKDAVESVLKEVDSKEEAKGTLGELVERATKKGLEKSFAKSDKENSSSTWDRLFEKKDSPERTGGPKERLETRFDRAMFKVAKNLVESRARKEAEKNGSPVDESVDSVFESVIDRVQKTIKKNKNKALKGSSRRSGRRGDGNWARDKSLVNDRAAIAQRSGNRNDRGASGGGRSDGGMFDSLDKTLESTKETLQQADLNMELPAFSNLNWRGLLMILGSIALLVMLALVLWQNVGPEPSARQKRRRKSKPITKIRSPKDLVEAFDGFLLDTFGYRSDWWNANHAAKVIVDQAPDYQGKVGDLVDDYVAARYAPAAGSVATGAKDHLSTLKELAAKEFSKGNRIDGDQVVPAES